MDVNAQYSPVFFTSDWCHQIKRIFVGVSPGDKLTEYGF